MAEIAAAAAATAWVLVVVDDDDDDADSLSVPVPELDNDDDAADGPSVPVPELDNDDDAAAVDTPTGASTPWDEAVVVESVLAGERLAALPVLGAIEDASRLDVLTAEAACTGADVAAGGGCGGGGEAHPVSLPELTMSIGVTSRADELVATVAADCNTGIAELGTPVVEDNDGGVLPAVGNAAPGCTGGGCVRVGCAGVACARVLFTGAGCVC